MGASIRAGKEETMKEMNTVTFFVSGYGSREDTCMRLVTGDPGTGRFEVLAGYSGMASPSYLALWKAGDTSYLYTFEENSPGGAVMAYRLTEAGPVLLSRFEADWIGPCHISVSDRGDMVFAASYMTGNVASFRIEADMSLTFACRQQHEGVGVHFDRQRAPHCHYCEERDGQLYVVDLGLDKVFLYNVDHETGSLTPSGRDIQLPPASGPRHLFMPRLHPDRMYVLTELSAQVFFYERVEGVWTLRQTENALPGLTSDPALMVPPTADLLSIGAAIKMSADERYLFVSCRLGYQRVTAFRIADDGSMTFCDTELTGGITPRDIAVVEDTVLVANQDSGLVTFLHFDRISGRLTRLPATFRAGKPTCLVPVNI